LERRRPQLRWLSVTEEQVIMASPDKVFGSGKRDAESVSSDKRELPSDDQRAYRVVQPERAQGTTAAKAKQRRASRATGVRNPEADNGNGDATQPVRKTEEDLPAVRRGDEDS
jgi:hypothetical protein